MRLPFTRYFYQGLLHFPWNETDGVTTKANYHINPIISYLSPYICVFGYQSICYSSLGLHRITKIFRSYQLPLHAIDQKEKLTVHCPVRNPSATSLAKRHTNPMERMDLSPPSSKLGLTLPKEPQRFAGLLRNNQGFSIINLVGQPS